MELELPQIQPKSSRDITVESHGDWAVVTIEDRLDSFNFDKLTNEIEGIMESKAPYLILNLETTSFISIPFIKNMSRWAHELKVQSLPFILMKPSEKIKRQIDIFAKLDDFHVARSEDELPSVDL